MSRGRRKKEIKEKNEESGKDEKRREKEKGDQRNKLRKTREDKVKVISLGKRQDKKRREGIRSDHFVRVSVTYVPRQRRIC